VAIGINRSAVLTQPLFQVLALNDSENQNNSVSIDDLVHDPIVADAHSQESVSGSLDGFDKLAGWSGIPS
jgi:hypothetical protein